MIKKYFANIFSILLVIIIITGIGYFVLHKPLLPSSTQITTTSNNQNSPTPFSNQKNTPTLSYKQYESEGKYHFAIFVDDSKIYDSPNILGLPAQVVKTPNQNIQILWPNGGIDLYIVNLQTKKVLPIIYKGAVSPTYISIILGPSWSLTTGKSLAITTFQSAWNGDSTQITDLALNSKPLNILDAPISVHRPETREAREIRDYKETVKLIPTGVSEDLTKLYFSLVVEELEYRRNFSFDIERSTIKVEPNSGILLPVPDLELSQ